MLLSDSIQNNLSEINIIRSSTRSISNTIKMSDNNGNTCDIENLIKQAEQYEINNLLNAIYYSNYFKIRSERISKVSFSNYDKCFTNGIVEFVSVRKLNNNFIQKHKFPHKNWFFEQSHTKFDVVDFLKLHEFKMFFYKNNNNGLSPYNHTHATQNRKSIEILSKIHKLLSDPCVPDISKSILSEHINKLSDIDKELIALFNELSKITLILFYDFYDLINEMFSNWHIAMYTNPRKKIFFLASYDELKMIIKNKRAGNNLFHGKQIIHSVNSYFRKYSSITAEDDFIEVKKHLRGCYQIINGHTIIDVYPPKVELDNQLLFHKYSRKTAELIEFIENSN